MGFFHQTRPGQSQPSHATDSESLKARCPKEIRTVVCTLLAGSDYLCRDGKAHLRRDWISRLLVRALLAWI